MALICASCLACICIIDSKAFGITSTLGKTYKDRLVDIPNVKNEAMMNLIEPGGKIPGKSKGDAGMVEKANPFSMLGDDEDDEEELEAERKKQEAAKQKSLQKGMERMTTADTSNTGYQGQREPETSSSSSSSDDEDDDDDSGDEQPRGRRPYGGRGRKGQGKGRGGRAPQREKKDWSHSDARPLEELAIGDAVEGPVTATRVYQDVLRVWIDIGAQKDATFLAAEGNSFNIEDSVSGLKIWHIDVELGRIEVEGPGTMPAGVTLPPREPRPRRERGPPRERRSNSNYTRGRNTNRDGEGQGGRRYGGGGRDADASDRGNSGGGGKGRGRYNSGGDGDRGQYSKGGGKGRGGPKPVFDPFGKFTTTLGPIARMPEYTFDAFPSFDVAIAKSIAQAGANVPSQNTVASQESHQFSLDPGGQPTIPSEE